MAFRWTLLLATAASAVVLIQMTLPISGEANTDLRHGSLGDATTEYSCNELPSNFYIWNSSWWFWPEFKDGRIFRPGKKIQKYENCDPFNDYGAMCEVEYTVLQLRYRFNVAVKDPKLEQHVQHRYPLHNIDAGNMTASVAAGPTKMTLKKDCGGDYFLCEKIDMGPIMVEDVVFDNFTATWQNKTVDTEDAVFQCRLRELLVYVVHKYFKDMSSCKLVAKDVLKSTKWMKKLSSFLATF
ncbi:hypothetical protein MRX96_051430 [Rhipicephalus microplus]|uniref:uncharacterized protein LOC119167481 isoform X1 n=1 Tax=Rhipicephalus microplus TaxID=6941 RepID=UPI003F6B0A82